MSSTNQLPDGFPKALLPPKNRSSGFLLGLESAMKAVDTIASIPQALKPRLGFSYAPPKFNFGWSISEDDVLDTLEATHHELIVNMPLYIPLQRTYEEDIDPEATMARVHEHMVNEWRLPSTWRPRLEYRMPESSFHHLDCLTITNTYDNGGEQPPADVVQAMKDIFQLAQEPKWFLDFSHGTWQHRWIVLNDDKEIEVMT